MVMRLNERTHEHWDTFGCADSGALQGEEAKKWHMMKQKDKKNER